MGEWIKCGKGFIEADVIRWQEGVFEDRSGARRRRQGEERVAAKIGNRRVAAQLLEENKKKAGYVKLRVVSCEEMPLPGRRSNVQIGIPCGTETSRAIKNILKGKPERLRSRDESARLAAVRQRIREKGGYLIAIPPRRTSPPRLQSAFGRAGTKETRPAVNRQERSLKMDTDFPQTYHSGNAKREHSDASGDALTRVRLR